MNAVRVAEDEGFASGSVGPIERQATFREFPRAAGPSRATTSMTANAGRKVRNVAMRLTAETTLQPERAPENGTTTAPRGSLKPGH